MKKLLEHLNALLTGQEERSLELRELKLSFVKNEKEILRNVHLCKKSGGITGIYSPVLGSGMFLCSVLDILHDKTIVLRPVDATGAMFSKTIIDVSEITAICPFNQVYSAQQNPLLQTAEADVPSQLNIFQNVN